MLKAFNTSCVVASSAVSALTILRHLKSYRKVSDQRLIVRILMMVPLFAVSAWFDLYSSQRWLSKLLVFIREFYEAFVIYAFYSLLTTLLGGEREIIYSTTGRPPLTIPVPGGNGQYKIELSDPPTFLLIKRLILQFVTVRLLYTPLWALVPSLGVLWTIAYNLSITLALNSLTVFWISLKSDLSPYRVVLKFLSVKLIVFFSYWQSLVLKVLLAVGLITDTKALKTIQCTLIMVESVGFAWLHGEAFPPSDYASTVAFGFGRLQIWAAVRDVLGVVDLLQDFKSTFLHNRYGYREFDSVEAVLDHPESRSRQRRLAAGLRYRNGGRSKYWLPRKSLDKILSGESLGVAKSDSVTHYGSVGEPTRVTDSPPPSPGGYEYDQLPLNIEDEWSEGEEQLYDKAKRVYGDYNYPIIMVRPSEQYVSFEDRLRRHQILSSV